MRTFKLPGGKLASPLHRSPQTELYDPRKHGIRQSMLSTWFECREKARLCTIHGWAPRVASVPFIYGSLSHGAIKQATRLLRENDGAVDIDTYVNGTDYYLQESEVEWLQETPNPTYEQKDIIENSLAILGKKMPMYFDYWYDQDKVCKWGLVEDKFKVELTMDDGETVPLIGTFDSTFRNDSGELWLFETKNKARWSENIGTLLPLDLQVGIYLTALQALYGQVPKGVRYNILRRPGERRKKDESLAEYSTRIQTNIIKEPEHYFHRMDIRLTPQEINEHMARTAFICEEFYRWWKETMKHSMERDLLWNSSSCDGKYGSCKMLDACANKDFTLYQRRSPAEASGIDSAE
jgi:hypothetical protein